MFASVRTPSVAAAGLLLFVSFSFLPAVGAPGAEPEAINPFGPVRHEREDAIPGYLETSDGKVYPGFSRKENVSSDNVKIITREGKEKSFSLEKLKGLLLVKDLKGNKEYDQVTLISKNSVKE